MLVGTKSMKVGILFNENCPTFNNWKKLQGNNESWHTHLPGPVESRESNRSIKHFPHRLHTTKYLEGFVFLSDRLVDAGASSCQAEDGRQPRLPGVPPPANHPHKPESHQESHSCAGCKYIGHCCSILLSSGHLKSESTATKFTTNKMWNSAPTTANFFSPPDDQFNTSVYSSR